MQRSEHSTLRPPVLSSVALSLGYGGTSIVRGLEMKVETGRTTGLIGANGSGKSTILRGLARLLKPISGSVLIDGRSVHAMKTRDIAKRLAILPQGPLAPEGITVTELAMQGRYPHQSFLRQWSREDARAVARALDLTAMTPFSERPIDTLSGGQRQRAWIAMTLAQETPILLLDEPTTFLDLAHQIDILELMRDLSTDHGATIVAVLHDLNQAARYCDRLVVLKEGSIVAEGAPRDVMTPEILRLAFELECRILTDPVDGSLLCIPVGRDRQRV